LFKAADGRTKIGRKDSKQPEVRLAKSPVFQIFSWFTWVVQSRRMFCVISCEQESVELNRRKSTMVSDLIMYALLASIFIVTGLRMFDEKPNKLKEILIARKRIKREK
jgi:hypothetical protein